LNEVTLADLTSKIVARRRLLKHRAVYRR